MRTPYLSWTTSNINLYDYSPTYPYKKADIITYNDMVYQSLSDDNINNDPINSPFWNRLL